MKYSLNSKDQKSLKLSLRNLHSNWQASVTERLVGNFIEDMIIPELKHQGWGEAIYTQGQGFKIFYDENELQKPKCRQGVWDNYVYDFLIENGLYPTEKFMRTLKKLISLLKHSPDGYLLKFSKTGKLKSIKKHSDTESKLLPIVNGEIELVEVKSGKARLFAGQKEDYCNALSEKFVLRFYHVDVISFEKNEFEIEEKIISSLSEFSKISLKSA